MCRRLTCLVSFLVMVLSLLSSAQAGEPTADTYVRGGDNGNNNYGTSGNITIKNSNGNSYDRKAYIRFDVAGKTVAASLELTVSTNNQGGSEAPTPQTFTVEVYGLAESVDHTWTETDITWNNAPANNTSTSDFTADATLLGSFIVEPLPEGNVVSFSDPALDDFINSDTDGQITIMLRRTPGASSSHNLAFASKENTSDYSPPTLNMGAATRAARPSPADGDIIETTWATLTWTPSPSAGSHDVYIGDNFDDVNNATPDSPVFQLNQSDELLIVGFAGFPFPDGLVPGTTYYWRIDEVNDADPNSPWKGLVWSFSIPPRTAHDPNPPDGARFVDTDIELSWTMGLNAKLHNIVFGDSFDDVNSAPAGIPASDTTFTPAPGTLEKGKTYYWRVDEVDPPTTVKGGVWSFTTMPDIPITDPNLVAWYKFEAGGGTKVIDFSGHENHGDIVSGSGGTVQWVPGQFNLALEFLGDNLGHVELPPGIVTSASGSVTMWVNTDQTGNAGMLWYGTENNGDGFGDQNETHVHVGDAGNLGLHIEGATDVSLGGPQIAGEGWNHVAVTWDLMDGCRLYFNGAEVDFQAHNNSVVDLAVIRLGRPVNTGNGNRYYDGLMDDVRLFDHAITVDQVNEIVTKGEDPDRASAPNPRLGALVGLDEALPLSWLAGESATTHDVYFGLDKGAVENADASDATGVYRGNQNTTTYSPPEGVEWGGGPYYWRIDENNNDGTVSEGGIWDFSVADFIPIDDFEGYTDDDAAGEAIWQTWDDGYADPANGSQVGYEFPTYVEQTIVHGGAQSMPLHYNNTAGVTSSEVSLKLDSQSDWTKHGVGELSIWVHGQAASVGSFTQAGGTITMTAAGADIWAGSDEFHYAYKTLSGIGSITVKVESLQDTDPFAKAGVMIRASLDPDSPYASLLLTPANGVRFQYRQNIGDITDREFDDTLVAPYWVRLERDAGGSFRGYTSADGFNWQQFTLRPMVSMDTNAYIGLALTSHAAGVTCEAAFSNIATTGNVTGQWINQDIGIAANDAEPLYVALYNATGAPAVVAHPDPAVANITTWTEWVVPLQDFANKGINLSDVDRIGIGLGATGGAAAGGSGVMFIDDIRLYRPSTP